MLADVGAFGAMIRHSVARLSTNVATDIIGRVAAFVSHV
jgi:hypothetical protein